MDFEEYLKENRLTVKEFSRKYELDYYGLNRVRNGAITRDRSIRKVFDELEIENDDPDIIKKVLSELEKQFNFTVNKENTNQSKVQRAWEHKK